MVLGILAPLAAASSGCGVDGASLDGTEGTGLATSALTATELGATRPEIRAALEALASGKPDGTCRGISVRSSKSLVLRGQKASHPLALGVYSDDCDKPKKRANDTDAIAFPIAPGVRSRVRAEIGTLTDDLECVVFVRAPRALDGEMVFTTAKLGGASNGGGIYLDAMPDKTSTAGVVCTVAKGGRIAPRSIPLTLAIEALPPSAK